MASKKTNSETEYGGWVEELKEKMIADAVRAGASDIHIEPGYDSMLIRFRISGELHPWDRRPLTEHEPFLSHLKLISGLDILKHSLPQEGHFVWSHIKTEQVSLDKLLDIRASIFPTAYGETVVMRMLNRHDLPASLDVMGFTEERDLILTREIVHQSHGMVLAAGPAGSGKTFTLYAILNELKDENKNIITLEDPIEYYLPPMRQSQINALQGFTYAVGLRSILRQDPDIIMVGEVRDLETAENAIRASLTGRLLLSTIHANSSIGTVTRLIDMNINRDLVAYAMGGVISKRLVRKNCEACRAPYTPNPDIVKALELEPDTKFFRGTGCEQCGGTGVTGRIGIFEILKIDEDFRRMIISGTSHADLLNAAREKGMKTLREDGIMKIKAGITTAEEVLKVIA